MNTKDFIFRLLYLSVPCRKTYTLNFRTIKKRCERGVVAKPGIATGSRSNKQGFIRERYPWIRGSNVRYTVTEQIPSAPLYHYRYFGQVFLHNQKYGCSLCILFIQQLLKNFLLSETVFNCSKRSKCLLSFRNMFLERFTGRFYE